LQGSEGLNIALIVENLEMYTNQNIGMIIMCPIVLKKSPDIGKDI